jgi:hypothetical protein
MTAKVKTLMNEVEFGILDLFMHLMETDSPTVRRVVAIGYYFMDRLPDRNIMIQGVFWVCLGTALGLGIGILAV